MLQEINTQNFEAYSQDSQNLLIEFGAEWCGPCRTTLPGLKKLSEDQDQLTVGKVDIDESQELAVKFSITNVPTMILFQNGTEVSRQVGAMSHAQLVEKFTAK